jgi:cobalt/nickel transport system permease protein
MSRAQQPWRRHSLCGTPSQLLSLKFGGGYLAVDDASLLYGVNLFFTALSAVSCLYFLSLTTPMVDIMGALRRMRCPAILIELMFLMYRFTFVLLDTAHAISILAKCRLGTWISDILASGRLAFGCFSCSGPCFNVLL